MHVTTRCEPLHSAPAIAKRNLEVKVRHVMRLLKVGLAILSSIVLLSFCAVAGQNSMGVADHYMISFNEPVRVAGQLLPAGSYEIRHEMEGPDHIMVFRQLDVKDPVKLRAKCTLVPLPAKAEQSQKLFAVSTSNERVLEALIFKGDLAKHVF